MPHIEGRLTDENGKIISFFTGTGTNGTKTFTAKTAAGVIVNVATRVFQMRLWGADQATTPPGTTIIPVQTSSLVTDGTDGKFKFDLTAIVVAQGDIVDDAVFSIWELIAAVPQNERQLFTDVVDTASA